MNSEMDGVMAIGIILVINSCVYSLDQYSFPDNFMFGVASSAYQIEGAWNEEGKGENIWDHSVHDPELWNGPNADTAANSYHKYKEDVALIKKMNLGHYKFSLSWTRILPSGFNDSVNQAGINYYRNLLSELRNKNIIPMVTLYHWDLPQSIQDKGGWTNEETIQYFVDYARIVFQNFPDVDYWITIHEPKQVCRGGYGNGCLAPFIFDSGRADYKCAYVILKAHAAVYHMYKNEFPDSKGKVSIALDGSWSQPRVNTKNEIKAAKRRHDFEFGLYANPIFVNDWPQTVKQIVYARSEKKHFNGSRLPYFSPEEISEIRGTADFMALNYYGARGVEDAKVDYDTYGYDNDLAVKYWQNDSWVEMSSGLSVVPWSIQSFLSYVRDDFHVTEIIITGNGVEDEHPTQDNFRINYIADHLQYILKAIYKNGINVTGYTYCNLLDSFEWNEAYSPHYGLYSVDDDKSRSAKDSVDFYRRVATEHKIPVDIPPTGYPTTAKSESTISSRTTTTTMKTTITTSTGTTDGRKYSGSSSSGVSGLLLTLSMSVSIYLKLF